MTDSATAPEAGSTPAETAAPTASFSQLNLAEPLSRAVAEMGYSSMTPIQAQAIPVVLTGRDVMGAAQTGTGKTAAFSLPLLQRMLRHENASTSPARHPVRALVLLPTRELADQVAQQIKLYAKYTQLRSTVVFGGIDMKPQTAELKKGVEVLVATPGRLLDHIEAKNAVLNQVEYVVLDEADRMLDIGFLPDLQRILSYLPKQRTTLLFSATFSPEIKRLAGSYLQDPTTIEVARSNATASTVEQHFYSVGDDNKRRALHQILRKRQLRQAFVFVNSKLGCARLARALEREGLKTNALHGDRSQDERLKALDAFKKGEVDLLVCTDVAARGLDIKDVPAVFNFDIPFNAEDYVHRIGRTGRAGASGLAVSFAGGGNDARLVAEIEKLIKTKIEIEAFEYDEDMPRIREQGRFNEGRRAWGGDDPRDVMDGPRGRPEPREPREPRERAPRRSASVAQDPFFNQPYEANAPASGAPGWESKRETVRSGVSANIKPKRKLAALFKAPAPAPAAAPQPETSAG
ncbi:DEAD/DEAH box helicase [Pseudorhodoferax sp. Leaf274]|uniref:DEAD/DEAH box helicase n=1 Tax=Pseudorhodoferax sp. Leaf274 TaxID=1736318 RepID=UPI000703BB5B|nr:DEAD/DEAH box helicase [Pseudorhodoferax sp. Leaf274]KQP43186.1 ATP-dependent RNA helicase [Pseudorhodoferax sp. Leaf274]